MLARVCTKFNIFLLRNRHLISNKPVFNEYICEIKGSLAILKLNRPRSLNSLSLGLIRSLQDQLLQWENDPSIKVILIKGGGDKAFCSGGDIISIINSARDGGSIHNAFFPEEYCLSKCLSSIVLVITGII